MLGPALREHDAQDESRTRGYPTNHDWDFLFVLSVLEKLGEGTLLFDPPLCPHDAKHFKNSGFILL